MVEVDRSRIISFQQCPRQRYLAYHACGKGLQRKAKSLPLQVGSAFHAGAECLLQGDIETAVYRAIKYLADAFKERGVGMDGEEVTDASLVYSAQEQMALAEGLIRAWGLEKLPDFLSTFEVIEVEKEGRATLTTVEWESLGEGGINSEPELVLMFRPDALVRERLSGDLYVVSWKTTSQFNKRTLSQCRTDMQSMSEVWGIQNALCEDEGCDQRRIPHICVNDNPSHIEGVLYQFIVKGKRQFDDWNQRWEQNSHLCYGWKNVRPRDEFDTDWSWTFRYPREDGSGNSTLGKGWKKLSIWDNYPGGVKAWIESLHQRVVFPRHLDPFEGIFPQSLPVERRRDEVESWKRQVVGQEVRIAEALNHAEPLDDYQDRMAYLDEYFPQHTGACHQYSGCQFIPICHEGIPDEPGELYSIRVPNHPSENGDEDE